MEGVDELGKGYETSGRWRPADTRLPPPPRRLLDSARAPVHSPIFDISPKNRRSVFAMRRSRSASLGALGADGAVAGCGAGGWKWPVAARTRRAGSLGGAPGSGAG